MPHESVSIMSWRVEALSRKKVIFQTFFRKFLSQRSAKRELIQLTHLVTQLNFTSSDNLSGRASSAVTQLVSQRMRKIRAHTTRWSFELKINLEANLITINQSEFWWLNRFSFDHFEVFMLNESVQLLNTLSGRRPTESRLKCLLDFLHLFPHSKSLLTQNLVHKSSKN